LVPRALPLLAESEDAIAAVLAHELAHLTLRHSDRYLRAKAAGAGASLRELKGAHEREADIAGLMILANAGYDARAAISHLRAVDALARARKANRPPARGKRTRVHDDVETRVQRLDAQVRACRIPVAATRPVASAVRSELQRDVDRRTSPQKVHLVELERGSPAPGVSRAQEWLAFGGSERRKHACCVLLAPP
jgi:predicted Zn-dependent protease